MIAPVSSRWPQQAKAQVRGPTHGCPSSGTLLTAVGVVHVLVAPIFYSEAVRSIVDAGVVASVEANENVKDLRGSGFWYVTAGLVTVMFGTLLSWTERRDGTLPWFVGWMLLALGVWGCVLLPASPFWAFFGIAALAFHRRRQHLRYERRSAAPR